METRYYQAQGIDVDRLANELERMFLMQGYQVQHFGNNDQMTVQIKKGGDFAAIIGMQRALTLTMQRAQGGVLAMIGQQKWADKAAVGVVGMLVLWPLAFTAGAGAIQQAQLGSQVIGSLDMLVRQQIPNVQLGPIPPGMMPQGQQPGAPPPYQPPMPPQQQAAPPPSPPQNKLICANCHAENDEGAIYCMSCGHVLAPKEQQKTLCPMCGAETKPNATFCTQCGTPLSH
jgi:ribosomal protein L40E